MTIPNLSRKDTRALFQRALNWCALNLSADKPSFVAAAELNVVFGTSNSQSSRYLRSKLLIRTNAKFCPAKFDKQNGTGKCQEYQLNQAGFDEVQALVEPMKLTLSAELEDQFETGFVYSDKSNRYWNPIQNYRRAAKVELFLNRGYRYDYDFEACAPTIILQLSEQTGVHEVAGRGIKDYLAHKAEYRQLVSDLTGLDLQEAKRLINSLFTGAGLAANAYCSAFKTLNYDRTALKSLQQNKQIKALRVSIRCTWRWISYKEKTRYRTCKDKWGVYFRYERLLLDIVRTELAKQGETNPFLEHDGWRTQRPVQIGPVLEAIETQTGLKMSIKEIDHGSSLPVPVSPGRTVEENTVLASSKHTHNNTYTKDDTLPSKLTLVVSNRAPYKDDTLPLAERIPPDLLEQFNRIMDLPDENLRRTLLSNLEKRLLNPPVLTIVKVPT